MLSTLLIEAWLNSNARLDWSLLPVSSIRRIEALRGPGASLYGDAAIGGVIQVFTDRSVAGGQANVGAGSFSTVTSDASYGRSAGPVRFNVHGSAKFSEYVQTASPDFEDSLAPD